ncbi:aromatic amino acid ammonia-lyase [Rhizobium calliandrae]|uniref:Aromatic amino acid ammonia-lyase n=1 Tax=Rhizobium calliandrae TaxID=1312182 RepID=A0ABT7KFP7_9HYPH|nr:aromatic amino acid ammonia-lyase [Rhizobium calliandrae]MDL2407445.1 aromatic amino acid ammonia-lyase [Rhizobium calliandrae]
MDVGVKSVIFDALGADIDAICAVARDGAEVTIGADAIAGIEAAYACLVRHAGEGKAIYGVSTGLGAAVDTRLDLTNDSGQHRIPRPRAVGVGRFAETDEVRAMMAARLARFCLGYSGVSPEMAQALVGMLNRAVYPKVPMTGSIGEADLPPLAHVALVLVGEGTAILADGREVSGADALAAAGLVQPPFGIKDGLSLISSNAASVGLGCLLLQDTRRVFAAHIGAVALSYEGFRACLDPLDPLASRLRPGPGQGDVAAAIRSLLEGGDLTKPGAARRLQDPLSLRCVPSVSGAALHALRGAWAATELELRSGDDNPSVLAAEDVVLPTGNFDPTHMVLAFDTLTLALARLAAMTAERIMKLLSPGFSDLPRFLAPDSAGANGFGALQKTVAALTAEIGHLAMPMPFAVTPVADRVEDYASLAMSVVDKTGRLMEKLRYLTAIELIVAARAIDLRGAMELGEGTKALFAAVRSIVPPLEVDRSPSNDIYALADGIAAGTLIGPLSTLR